MAQNDHAECWIKATDARKNELLAVADALPADEVRAALKWLRELPEDERAAHTAAYSHVGYYGAAVRMCREEFTLFKSAVNAYVDMVLGRHSVQYDPEELTRLVMHYRKHAFFEKVNTCMPDTPAQKLNPARIYTTFVMSESELRECQAYIHTLEAEMARRDAFVRNSDLVHVDSMKEWIAEQFREDMQGVIDKYMEPEIFAKCYAPFLRELSPKELNPMDACTSQDLMKIYLCEIQKDANMCDSKKYERMCTDYDAYVQRTRREFMY
jgi:hypothetical protein